jgi:hypothetical protein
MTLLRGLGVGLLVAVLFVVVVVVALPWGLVALGRSL